MKFINYCRANFSYVSLSVFLAIALFNPVFKKYDYGAGFPLLLILGVLLAVLGVIEFLKKREKNYLEMVFLMIFAGAVILSFYFSQTKNFGFSEVLAFSSMVPLYLLFAHKKNEWAGKFLDLVMVLTIFAVLVGYFIYIFSPETRMFGPFFNINYHANEWPNAFALFLLMTWPIFLFLPGETPQGKYSKLKVCFILGFVFSALMLTYSRGAFVVLGGQIALLFVYFLKRMDLKTILFVLFTASVMTGFFFGANALRAVNYSVIDVEERATFSNSESITSKQERIDFWKGAIELTKEKPIFGWGPFSFRQAYNPIQETLLGSSDHPHNIFLKISAENGLIALFGFVAFLLTVFCTVASRFSKLSQKNKDAIYILGVAVAGAFAHNLIDYNFNFIANLLLLFVFIALIRSFVIKKLTLRKSVLALILAIVVAVFSLFEGTLLVLSKTVDESYLTYSFFPRNYYLNEADNAISDGDLQKALNFVEKQIELNPLDSQAWYLKGVVYCNEEGQNFSLDLCKESFEKALELNPMNDFAYYRDYFRVSEEIPSFISKITPILEEYFTLVENNVHFTAYTQNVEAVSDLIDYMLPYLTSGEEDYLIQKKNEMLEIAEKLRATKTF
jgi:O-antigen ligase